MKPLPDIYKNRAAFLRLSLDMGLSAAEINELVTPMSGKSEEEKENMAQSIICRLKIEV